MSELPEDSKGPWEITRWDDEFCWQDCYGSRGSAWVNESGVPCIQTYGDPHFPAEHLIAFLSGEGPPEPPIKVGDRVQRCDNGKRGVLTSIERGRSGGTRRRVLWDGWEWPSSYFGALVRVDEDGAA